MSCDQLLKHTFISREGIYGTETGCCYMMSHQWIMSDTETVLIENTHSVCLTYSANFVYNFIEKET